MVFDISPPPSSVHLVIGGIAFFLFVLTLLFGWLFLSVSDLSVTVTNQSLEVNIPLYGRVIPISNLALDTAEVSDIHPSSPFRPAIRTNGIGLPGYAVGWFKLTNGDKALLSLTSRERVVYILTTDGYSLLLSVNDPDTFIQELKLRGGGS